MPEQENAHIQGEKHAGWMPGHHKLLAVRTKLLKTKQAMPLPMEAAWPPQWLEYWTGNSVSRGLKSRSEHIKNWIPNKLSFHILKC